MPTCPGATPTILLAADGNVRTVLPVHLDGDEAWLDRPTRLGNDARLVLAWTCGAVTELPVRALRRDERGHATHLEVCAVEGDWRPFLRWLGDRLA